MTITPRAATRSIVLLTALSCSTVAAFGADHFVSPAGSGAACSQLVPCSLATALAAAQDGDRVYVGAGTYVGAGPDVASVSRGIEVLGAWNGVG